MKSRLLMGFLICLLTSCYKNYSERTVYFLSVREILFQKVLQVYEEMGYTLETDNRHPDLAVKSLELQNSFLTGTKGRLKIMSTFRRNRAETSVEVRVSQTGTRFRIVQLDKIADEVVARLKEKMRTK